MHRPPYPLARLSLNLLSVFAEEYLDRHSLQLLWWQASISEGGINQHLTRAEHWACQT